MCIHLIMVEYINPASLPSPLPPSLHPPPGPLYPFIPLAVVPPPPPPGPRLHRTQHPRWSNSHTATDAEAGGKGRGHALPSHSTALRPDNRLDSVTGVVVASFPVYIYQPAHSL